MNSYLIFVGKSGETIPVGIFNERYQKRYKKKSDHTGCLECVMAESIEDAVEKVKGAMKLGREEK